MDSPLQRIRSLTMLTTLALAVAAIAAPAAFGVYSPQDGWSPADLRAAQSTVADGRSPDTVDAAVAAASTISDGRSPDTIDAAQTAHSVIVKLTPSSFDWGDAGVGAGFGVGLIMLLGGAGLVLRTHRKEGPGFHGKPAMHQP
jgi:hypothetical protein